MNKQEYMSAFDTQRMHNTRHGNKTWRCSNANQQVHLCLAAAVPKNRGFQHNMPYTLHLTLVEILLGFFAQFVFGRN